MATINSFVGWETGGTEELSTLFGAFSIQSSVVRTGTFALQLDPNAAVGVSPFVDVASAGDDHIVGFAVRFTTLTPSITADFLSVFEGAGVVLVLALKTNGDLQLRDANGVEVGTATGPFIVNTWHYVEVRWQNVASGDADVFIDDVSKIAVTAEDFTDGSAVTGYEFDNLSGSGVTIYFDDFYVLSGAAGTGDFLGSLTEVVGPYQKTDGLATDIGDTLDTGTWALASETPVQEGAGSRAEYSGNPMTGGMQTDSGTRSGPSGDSRIDGDANIKAAKWIYRLLRGSGQTTTHEIRYGNSVDGMTNRVVNLTTNMLTFFKVSVAATEVPLSTEFVQTGMAVTGKRDIEMGEAWAMLLHVADAAPAVDLDELGAHQTI